MSDATETAGMATDLPESRTSSWWLLGPGLFVGLQLVAVLIVTPALPVEIALAIEGVLGAVLGLSLLISPPRIRTIGAYLITGGLFSAIVLWGLVNEWGLALVGLALVMAGVLLFYGIHRYERVQLGLVTDGRASPRKHEGDT